VDGWLLAAPRAKAQWVALSISDFAVDESGPTAWRFFRRFAAEKPVCCAARALSGDA